MRKLAISAAALAVMSAGGAYADFSVTSEKIITIKGGVFFPPVMLTEPGEKVRFINNDETTHDATADDGSWTTGPIEPGADVEIIVTGYVNNQSNCFKSTFNEEVKGAFGDPETGTAPDCFELSGEGEMNN